MRLQVGAGASRLGGGFRVAAAFAVAVALAATACTPKGSSPSNTPSASASSVPGPGPAWQAIFNQIQPDGTVSTQTALQAFSLTFGPLPGVTPPPGAEGIMPDGTGPLRWLVAHWSDITPAQQQAAVKLVPELGLPGATPSSSAGAVSTGPPGDAYLTAGRLPLLAYKQRRSNFFYTQEAMTLAQQIGAKVGVTLSIPIDAHVGPQLQGETDYAYVPVITPFDKCAIVVTSLGDALDGDDLDSVLAHEVWHCFQGAIIGPARLATGAAWIIEGQAEWVGPTLFPNAPIDADFWTSYLIVPKTSLFSRSYDAKGFYSQLAESGTDVWSTLIPILQASSNAAAFQASGADADLFLNLWASGFFRNPARGAAWDITGPGITKFPAIPGSLSVDQGKAVSASASAYADTIYDLSAGSSDVLLFSFPGHARVSDAAGHDYLIKNQPTVCLRSKGCECPGQDSQQVPPPLEASNIALAVTGDPSGDSGTVTGMSLDDFCNNVTGTWTGTWSVGGNSGSVTLRLVQTGQQVSGTITLQSYPCKGGASEFIPLPASGTVVGAAITLKTTIGQVTFNGTVKGTTMSGAAGPPHCGFSVASWQVTKSK